MCESFEEACLRNLISKRKEALRARKQETRLEIEARVLWVLAMNGLYVGYMSFDAVTGNVSHFCGAFGLHPQDGKVVESF